MLTRQKELSDLISCSYQSWYEDFRKNSIKSFLLQIPPEVLAYLRQDFFVLPKECKLGGTSSEATFVGEETNFDEEDSTEVDAPEFPEFSKTITETLTKLGKLICFEHGFETFHIIMKSSRRFSLCQNQLALPSRLDLDNSWSDSKSERPHRCLPIAQSLRHLQGRLQSSRSRRILLSRSKEVEGNSPRDRVQVLREKQKPRRYFTERLAAVPRALQITKAGHHQGHCFAVQRKDQRAVPNR